MPAGAAALVGLTALALVLLLAPGWVIGRCAGLGRWASLSVAPGVTSALVAAQAIALGALGWRWNAAALPVLLALTAACGLLARLALRRGSGAPIPRGGPGSVRRALGLPVQGLRGTAPVICAVALCIAVIVAAWLAGVVRAQWPAQAFDAAFHLSAVTQIRQGGDASLLGGLRELYQGTAVYYPTVWHALAALLPGPVPLAANAGVLAMAVAWPAVMAGMLLGAEAMAKSANRAGAVALTTALVGAPVSFTMLVTSLAVWPYALCVLSLPGALLMADRLVRGQGSRPATALLLALTAGGAVAAHGAGAFCLLLLAPAWLPQAWAAVGRRWPRARIGLLAAAAIMAGAGMWILRLPLASVLGYQRPAGGWSGVPVTAGQALADLPAYGRVWSATALLGAVIAVATMAGAWIGWRVPAARRWVAMWATALALTIMVGGPAWWGRQLGSPWYLQKGRLLPLVAIPAALLICLALSRMLDRLAPPAGAGRGWRRAPRRLILLAAVAALVAVGRLPLHQDLVASVHDPERIQYGTLATASELEFMGRAAQHLPPGAVVVASPSRGGTLLWAVGGVEVVYPVRSVPASHTPHYRLASAWPDLSQDDEEQWRQACALLDGLGAHYLYTDSSPDAEGARDGQPPLRWDNALADRRPARLELVVRQGDYALWRISACDGRP
ncbi:DUF6541 domain-containing protein [Actinomyces slackii]|uniref:Glycosyltransferase RgtA/B/C/D-like domain-containing protein n=2 Tax=Actinomyces slackii TaxID=52774 RepID=A0A448KG42_9ACTO|nr:DUF6541 family protein [Actinomyces slackii]VEG75875.1 Uncharacterised protein [Actinomyces slackii]